MKIFFILLGNFLHPCATMGIENIYSNKQLLDGMRNNNKKVMTFIYRYYYPMIEPIILNRYKGSVHDAKDVFQDALIVIYEGACSDPPLKIEYSFFTFLATICKRNMIGKIRKRVRLKHFTNEDELPAGSEIEIHELINRADRNNLYQKHFKEIGEICQKLIKLVFEGFSNKEITEKLNLSSESYTKKRRTLCKDSLFRKIFSDPKLKELINGKPWNVREIPRW